MKSIFNLLVVICVSCTAMAQEQKRPNIVFIFSDDHAVKALSAYDDTLMQTPNIDRIAKKGMRFDRAYVGNAVCGPSRATLLTGKHSHANGYETNDWSGEFNGHQETLPKLLQQSGYKTAVFGKWHLMSDPVGFDDWSVIDNVMEQGTYYNPSFRSPAGIKETTGYVAEIVTDQTISWLKNQKQSEQPFLLMYNHKSPHRDWIPAPQELAEWDESATLPEPNTLLRSMDGLSEARQNSRMSIADDMTDLDVKLSEPSSMNEEQLKLWEATFAKGNEEFENADLTDDEITRWKYQRYIKTYTGSVKSMDREIGRLLDYLEANNLDENTIIIYSSDQGFYLGENGWFDKRWINDVSSKIPLLIQWPNHIKEGSSTSALVQNIDFAPTLLDAAGVEIPEAMQGISLLPVLTDDEFEPQSRDLYYQFYENPGFHGVARHYGIISERYKLANFYNNEEWELFDTQTDPDEQINLYGQPGYEKVTADLKQRLLSLRAQYKVPSTDDDPQPPWYYSTLIRVVEMIMGWM
ncbi:sulfatase [Alteromonas sp. M12]|uniref:sulfatase family protein n=1 Tax=Alteromonas sp. M12 TaxID=3135644 RepID=UPI00319DEFC0